ncbi:hypothetical protein LSAT2_002340 [Lamellibrachia satsuma]|nr:hypothetical protein LSAT2_002340 [Lamellibrachia satsuma]
MPKGFLVRRRRSHAPPAWRRSSECDQTTKPVSQPPIVNISYPPPTRNYELSLSYPLNLSTTDLGLGDVGALPSTGRHRIITDLTPPSSPVPSTLATLLAGPPLYCYPMTDSTKQAPSRTADITPVPTAPPHTVSETVKTPQPEASCVENETLKVVCRGDIDPSLNFVEATPEAQAELDKIENLIGAYICRLCSWHFDDAFKLAVHKCEKIVNLEYACPDCSKVFQYAAHLASHRRWHKPRSGVKTKNASTKQSAS